MRSVSLIVLLVLSAPALAQETPAVEKPAEKKICRSVAATGSIMGKRECRTKAEWDAIAERSRNDRDKFDRDHRIPVSRPGSGN